MPSLEEYQLKRSIIMKVLNIIALALLVIGGLNWGLVGLFDFNLVSAIFGIDSILSNTVYVIVALSAIYCAFALKTHSTREMDTRHRTHTA
jgi:uncharacterized membrane protein YuzA (DUF378 family)